MGEDAQLWPHLSEQQEMLSLLQGAWMSDAPSVSVWTVEVSWLCHHGLLSVRLLVDPWSVGLSTILICLLHNTGGLRRQEENTYKTEQGI